MLKQFLEGKFTQRSSSASFTTILPSPMKDPWLKLQFQIFFSRTLLILFVPSLSSLIHTNIFLVIYWLSLDIKNATVICEREDLETNGFINFLCSEQLLLLHYHYKCMYSFWEKTGKQGTAKLRVPARPNMISNRCQLPVNSKNSTWKKNKTNNLEKEERRYVIQF